MDPDVVYNVTKERAKEIMVTIHKNVIDTLSLESAMCSLSELVPFLNEECTSSIGVGPDSGGLASIFFLAEKPISVYKRYDDFYYNKKSNKNNDDETNNDDYKVVGSNYRTFFIDAIDDIELKTKVRFISMCNLPYQKNHPADYEDYLRLYVPLLLRHIELFKPKVIFCYSSVVWRILTERADTDIIEINKKWEKGCIRVETNDEHHVTKIYNIKHPYVVLEKENSKQNISFYKNNIKWIINDNFHNQVNTGDPVASTVELMRRNATFFIREKEKKALAKKDKTIDLRIYKDAKNKEKTKEKIRNEKFTSMGKQSKRVDTFFNKKSKVEVDDFEESNEGDVSFIKESKLEIE